MNNKVVFLDLSIKTAITGNLYFEKMEELSKYFQGYIIAPVVNRELLKVDKIGLFKFVPFLYILRKFPGRNFINGLKLFFITYHLVSKDPLVNIIVAKTPLFLGLIAVVISKLKKKKLIIEVNGDFKSAFKYERPSGPRLIEKIKEKIACIIIKITLNRANKIKLLYKEQIQGYNLKSNLKDKIVVFHDYVPVTKISKMQPTSEKYILSLGYPWFLKGMDILIKAFLILSTKHPDIKLKIHGWCPEEKDYFVNLAGRNKHIELNNSVDYKTALELISKCELFVLASRTEAMGRVLLEAMALNKAIVAADVGGIPTVVKDGFNGLLFKSGSVSELYEKMEILLNNGDYSIKLANNGNKYVLNNLSEEKYCSMYFDLIRSIQ